MADDITQFSDLLGHTLADVRKTTADDGEDRLIFTLDDGREFMLWHRGQCCESVSIEDICGQLEWLVGSPLVQCEEVTNAGDDMEAEPRNEATPPDWQPEHRLSWTWTFYKMATVKGYVPKEWELAFLPLDSREGQDYLTEMHLCLDFAYTNREHMMFAIQGILRQAGLECGDYVDVHHNYATIEHHFGHNVMVHRKGAVRARAEETVLIPGSMGSASYIATGLGCPDSFDSCSHGAGRRMGRKAAMRDIPAEDVLAEMQAADITLVKPKMNDVAEECRAAYKDIAEVMAAQTDLVSPVLRLRPLAVVKA